MRIIHLIKLGHLEWNGENIYMKINWSECYETNQEQYYWWRREKENSLCYSPLGLCQFIMIYKSYL
jgi:hypothetical protein